MTVQKVPINANVLLWARRESGFSREALAEAVGVNEAELQDWESGEDQPSRGQFTSLVKKLARPSALFFLPAPPTASELKVGLRTAPGSKARNLLPKERNQLRWAQSIQTAVASVIEEDWGGPELPNQSIQDDPRAAGENLRARIGPDAEEQLAWVDDYQAFREWRALLEEFGVLVLQLGMGEEGIRGFSVWDRKAPLVAVNRSYLVTARIYTLFHEVGHLVTRTDYACASFSSPIGTTAAIERWSERFAAGFLLPQAALNRAAATLGATTADPEANVATAVRIGRRFKVSARASAIALIDAGLAPPNLYAAVDATLRARSRSSGGGAGERREAKRLSELGARATGVLLSAADRSAISQRDLARYLKLTTNQVDELRFLAGSG